MDFQRFALAYTASIKSIDDSVGEMVATLEELELLDNTIIVYAGDNGMFLGEHGMTDKRSMHEPSIRVPLIVRYSARIRPGQVRDDLVLNVDVAPSILEWCDAEPLPNIHGQSFAGLLEDVLGGGLHGGGVGHVHCLGPGFASQFLHLGGDFGGIFLCARDADHIGAHPGEGDGHGASDPPTGPGDHGHLVIQ